MLLAAIFVILGIGIITKRSVQISSGGTISGKKVINLGILFIVTGMLNLVSLYTKNPGIGVLTLLLEGLSILMVIYLIIFGKNETSSLSL